MTPMTDVPQSSPGNTPPTLNLIPPEAPPHSSPAARKAGPLIVRIWSLFTCTLCFGMLGVGLYLSPSPTGTGTHEQLGLPPCGFLAATGYPCPTCGCTTAVSHFAHGHFVASFLTQPFGFTVALVALIAGCLALIGAVTGRWIGPDMFTLQWYWRVWVFGGIGILVFGWVYKIMMIRMAAH